VTTSSLEALQKYSQALRAVYTLGEVDRGIDLLEEAILLDTTFAAAYSELATALSNRREERARAVRAFTKAYEYRDRLTDRERYIMMGNYHLDVTRERDKAIAAYQTALETYPDDAEALNNLGVLYFQLRDFTRSEELMLRALATDSSVAVTWGNVIIDQVAQGKFDAAEATLAAMRGKVPEHPSTNWNASALASSRGDYETAESHIRGLRESRLGSLSTRAGTSGGLAALARVQGRLAEAERHKRDQLAANEERGLPSEVLGNLADLALLAVWFRGDPDQALREIDTALQRYPLESFDPLDRPYLGLARVYAWAGSPEKARELVAEREATLNEDALRGGEAFSHGVKGVIALAEIKPQEAIAEFRTWDEGTACTVCALPFLAMAYDLAGQPDSVVAINERYLETPWLWRVGTDSYSRALAYERLGQLYEERGDTQKAIHYYGRLLELWKDADPELQPRVESAQRAIAALSPDR
jgi:tetratricopeptide (TPR) repeat protein